MKSESVWLQIFDMKAEIFDLDLLKSDPSQLWSLPISQALISGALLFLAVSAGTEETKKGKMQGVCFVGEDVHNYSGHMTFHDL